MGQRRNLFPLVLGLAILGNAPAIRADTIFTATSASGSWNGLSNSWSVSGPGFSYSGAGQSDPSAFLIMFPLNTMPEPIGYTISERTEEYRGPSAVNTGTFILDGMTYSAGSSLSANCMGAGCGSISVVATVSGSFDVPVGPAVITIPAVLSGTGTFESCAAQVCPPNAPSAPIVISLSGELTVTVDAPFSVNGQYAESFSVDFTSATAALPEPGAILLATTGSALLALLQIAAARRSRPHIVSHPHYLN